MSPYLEILKSADRAATPVLLTRLRADDLGDDELELMAESLATLSDPRSFGALLELLEDIRRPVPIRRAVGRSLRNMEHSTVEVPEGRIRGWWQASDAVLREHALLSMDAHDCPDLVEAVASDPNHPMQADALGQMDFGFASRRQQEIKIRALSHPNPEVRAAGARGLLWDEPIRGEEPLIRATDDPVPEVAAEAINTLQYYPTRRVVTCLERHLTHPDPRVREDAEESYGCLRGSILARLVDRCEAVSRRVRRWLGPTLETLHFADEELRPEPSESGTRLAESNVPARTEAEIVARLTDLDTSPLILSEVLDDITALSISEAGQNRITELLLNHFDPFVRGWAVSILSRWQDEQGLLRLARDSSFAVRKSAIYWLSRLPNPNPAIGELAWQYLRTPTLFSCALTEPLQTYVAHAPREEAIPRLVSIALDAENREELRSTAIWQLERLGAADELTGLLPLLQEEPQVTWRLHLAVLSAIKEVKLPVPDLSRLEEVDNLDVQWALGELEAAPC
jgi:HEAT repeat protein